MFIEVWVNDIDDVYWFIIDDFDKWICVWFG